MYLFTSSYWYVSKPLIALSGVIPVSIDDDEKHGSLLFSRSFVYLGGGN